MNRIIRACLGLAAICLLAFVAAPARSADPADGTISSASPKVKWSGELVESGFVWLAYASGQSPPCQAPNCDTFTLNVAESGDVLVTLDSGGQMGLEVVAPDGTKTWSDAASPAKFTIKKAAVGAYTLHITDDLVGTPGTYDGSAELLAPKTGAQPTATATPGATTTPQPGQPGQPAPGQPAQPGQPGQPGALPTIQVLTKKGKKAKKLAVKLRSSGAVSKVVVTLKKGSKKVGSAKLASLNGAGKATLKFKKKLKKGSYKLSVSGVAADGRKVAASAALKVK